jgi:hypothetical protein
MGRDMRRIKVANRTSDLEKNEGTLLGAGDDNVLWGETKDEDNHEQELQMNRNTHRIYSSEVI